MTHPIHELFTYKLHVIKKTTDRRMSDAFESELAMTLPEARLLLNIGALGPVSLTDLASMTHLDRSRASRATDALHRRGLVKKGTNTSDGRGVLLTLTDDGMALFRKAMAISQRCNQEILSVLSSSEQGKLDSYIERLMESPPEDE